MFFHRLLTVDCLHVKFQDEISFFWSCKIFAQFNKIKLIAKFVGFFMK